MTWHPMLGYREGDRDLADPSLYASAMTPFGMASGLPALAFESHAFARLEDEKIWTRSWVPVGVHTRIPNPGDLLPFTVGDHGVHVRRQPEGTLAGYFNFARHGGCRFVPRQCQSGNKTSCFYSSCGHSRDRDVVLADPDGHDTPAMYMYAGTNPDKLVPIRVAVCGPIAFVRLDDAREDLEMQLGETSAVLDRYAPSGWSHIGHHVIEGKFNWKLFAQAAAARTGEDPAASCDVRLVPPNLTLFRQADLLVLAIAQSIGLSRTALHVDVLAPNRACGPGTRGAEGGRGADLDWLRRIVACGETIQRTVTDRGTEPALEADGSQWRFNQWFLARLLRTFEYLESPLYAMPGRESNSGINAGPF